MFQKYGVPLEGKITLQQFVDWYHSIPETERDNPAGWMLKIAFDQKDELVTKQQKSKFAKVINKHRTQITQLASQGNESATDSAERQQNARTRGHQEDAAETATEEGANKQRGVLPRSLSAASFTSSCPSSPLPAKDPPGAPLKLACLPRSSSACKLSDLDQLPAAEHETSWKRCGTLSPLPPGPRQREPDAPHHAHGIRLKTLPKPLPHVLPSRDR